MGHITATYELVLDDPEIFRDDPVSVLVQEEEIKPQEGGQTDALSRPEFELLFGGAAGGGKSYILMLDALGLQYQDTEFAMAAYEHPDYRGVVFRRKTTHLAKLIDIGKEIYYPLGATFVLQRKGEPGACFEFPSGAKIYLCHLEQEKDKENHQGLEYQFIGFDELTQFLYSQYLYLFSRCRGIVRSIINPATTLPTRMRSTTNPTGEGLVWVRKRFIKNNLQALHPGKTYFFVADPDAEDPEDNPQGIQVTPLDDRFEEAKSRTFIPGFLHENKLLMEADPGYASNIMQMGRKMENALLKGDWDAFGGDFFSEFNQHTMAEKPLIIPKDWELVGALDPGWSSPCCFMLGARDYEKHFHLLFTYYVKGKDPETHARNIYKLIKNYPFTGGRMPDQIFAGRDAFAKKDVHSIKKTELTFADIFQDNGLYLLPAVTDRVLGWWAIKQYMINNMFHFFKGYNQPMIDEMLPVQHDEKNVEEISGGGNDPLIPDHALDTLRYLIMSLPYPFATKMTDLPEWAEKKWRRNKKSLKTSVMSR